MNLKLIKTKKDYQQALDRLATGKVYSPLFKVEALK